MKIPRNAPCPCGSRKKYKKCCGDPLNEHGSNEFFETTAGRNVLRKAVEMMNPLPPPRMVSRPQIQTINFGKKIRAVRNKIHFRPLEETFFDFQLNLLLWTLGKNWYDDEMRKPRNERHVILQWRDERNEVLSKYRNPAAPSTEPVRAPLTGNMKALHVLADDVYQLQHALKTPNRIIKRLANMHEFQGARYEIFVASLFARCGFEVEFIDDTSKKHPEFFATKDGERIAVEAKSRRRTGVLHEGGEFVRSAEPAPSRIRGLFQDAMKQNPGGMPFLIFIDVNLPLTPLVPPMQRKWVKEAMEFFEQIERDGSAKSDSGLILTNMAWHYHREVGAPPSESVTARPEHPIFPVAPTTWALLEKALNEYGVVVDEENPPPSVPRRQTTPGWFRYGYFVKGPNNSIRAAGDSFARTRDTYKKGDSLGVRDVTEKKASLLQLSNRNPPRIIFLT